MRQYRSPKAKDSNVKECTIKIRLSDEEGLSWQTNDNQLNDTEMMGALEVIKHQWIAGTIRASEEDE